MFKIKVNDDGSTSVFCNDSGKFICVVDDKRLNSKPLEEGRSTRLNFTRAHDRQHLKTQAIGFPIQRSKAVNQSSSAAKDPVRNGTTRQSQPSTSGANADASHESQVNHEKDYFEDCITQEEFLSALGVISKKHYEKTPLEQLQQDFPYRQISCVSKSRSAYYARNSKLCEELDICSYAVKRYLDQGVISNRYLLRNEQELSVCLNKNAHYCRTGDDEQHDNLVKLRSRDNALYSFVYAPKAKWSNMERTYSFTRKQHLERMETIRTGVTKRTRKLLKMCKTLTVPVKKLTELEVRDYTTPISADLKNIKLCVQAFHGHEPIGTVFISHLGRHPGLVPIYQKPEKFAHMQSQYMHPLTHTPPVRMNNHRNVTLELLNSSRKDVYSCVVVFKNIFQSLSQQHDGCYVAGTSIKVNDLTILPLKLWQSSPKPLKIVLHDQQKTVASHNDHAYHKSPSFSVHHIANPAPMQPANGSTSNGGPFLVAQKGSSVYPNHYNKQNGSRFTDDAAASSPKKILLVDITSDEEDTIYSHMTEYHSVSQPSLFLEQTYSATEKKLFVKAFPGYEYTP